MTHVQPTYDAVIVGARVSGATLAALLGDAGCRVLLVDRASFPSPTSSTHFFRGSMALGVFDRLGVLNEIMALGAPPLVREYSYAGGSAEPVSGPPQSPGAIGHNLSVRREPLDHLLVRRAQAARGVTLLERSRFRAVTREGDRVTGASFDTPHGELTVRARMVVGADGRHSAVAQAVAAPEVSSERGARGIYYTYVRGFPAPGGGEPDGPEFSLLEDEVAYVFPSDGGVACIAASLNRADFASLRGVTIGGFHQRLARHAGLTERLRASSAVTGMLGCGPELNFVRQPVGVGWALVGDAGLHQDPWTGRGIDLATTQAAALADALLAWFKGDLGEEEALERYRAHRDEVGLPLYKQTVELARDLRQVTGG